MTGRQRCSCNGEYFLLRIRCWWFLLKLLCFFTFLLSLRRICEIVTFYFRSDDVNLLPVICVGIAVSTFLLIWGNKGPFLWHISFLGVETIYRMISSCAFFSIQEVIGRLGSMQSPFVPVGWLTVFSLITISIYFMKLKTAPLCMHFITSVVMCIEGRLIFGLRAVANKCCEKAILNYHPYVVVLKESDSFVNYVDLWLSLISSNLHIYI